MEMYDDVRTAIQDFSGFQRRWSKVKNGFEEFFGNFNPDALQIPGISIVLDVAIGTCTIEAFSRKFEASLSPLLANDKSLVGNVEFVELVKEKRILIERFFITHQQSVMTLAGETLMPVADFSEQQTRHILNLLLQGLSRPINSTDD
ncbi:hypothetical protein [Pseudomonas sp. MWU318]|uniref:hypothetical protein n=1 Tax=Pseudomonas sp. MWU318 TaxID=2802569 RepID=UPI0019267853|nr:hypothetical protein [Pseudomonas sp. MWU318]